MMRKTKIICTIGPATDDKEVLRQMMRSGMNVARFNFSHGEYDEHERKSDFLLQLCLIQKDLKSDLEILKNPRV